MNTNNMMLEGDQQLEGTKWWSRDGSDHFTIHEVLISPEGFSVRTTDGRLLSADILEKYIQSDKPISDMITANKNQQPIDISGLDEVDSTSIHTDAQPFGSLKFSHPGASFKQPSRQQMVRKEPDPINDPLPGNEFKEHEVPEVPNELDAISYGMIDRVLGKANFEELVTVNINSIEKMDEGVVTLVNTLNIKRSELKSYIAGRLAERFESMINMAVDVYLDNLLGKETTEETSAE